MNKVMGVAALGVALVLGTGCGKAAEKANENAVEEAIEQAGGGDVDIDTDDGSVKVETEDGSVSIGTGDLPEGWPEDLPLPDGAEISGSAASGDTKNVNGTASSSADEVAAHFADLGWEETSETTAEINGRKTIYRSYEDDGRELSVSVTDAGDGQDTTFVLVLTTSAG